MFQGVAAFGAGIWARQQISDWQFPTCKCQRASDQGTSFRLSVRVLSAAVPSLGAPGLVSRQRPRAEICLGDARKETELAEHGTSSRAGVAGADKVSAAGVDCPWRFGDSLTFAVHLDDVVHGPGMRLCLRAHSDVRLGPLQVELPNSQELCEAFIDLRHRVLPACVHATYCDPDGTGADQGGQQMLWETPVLVIPLNHVKGAPIGSAISSAEDAALPTAAGHVALSFSINTDPEALLREAEQALRPLIERVVSPLAQWAATPVTAALSATCDSSCHTPRLRGCSTARGFTREESTTAKIVRSVPSAELPSRHSFVAPLPGDPDSAEARAAASGRIAAASVGAVFAPGIQPGRGSADRAMRCPSSKAISCCSHGAQNDVDGWVSLTGGNGRTFWHHSSLGPAPWEDTSLSTRRDDEEDSYHQEVVCVRLQEQDLFDNSKRIRHHNMLGSSASTAKPAVPATSTQGAPQSSRSSPRPTNADDLHQAFGRLDVFGTHGIGEPSAFGTLHERYRMQPAAIL